MKNKLKTLAVLLIAGLSLLLPASISANLSLFPESIIAYNHKIYQKSLDDGSYLGEEGILRIRPEIGRSLGLKVYIDQDYLDASKLIEEAKDHLSKALELMEEKGSSKKNPSRQIADLSLKHNKKIAHARKSLLSYRSGISLETDNRLDKLRSMTLMEQLLAESLKKTFNLRDALADFYNRCHSIESKSLDPINIDNIHFVNYVFREFMEKASPEAKQQFDLDRITFKDHDNSDQRWKKIAIKDGFLYTDLLENILKEHRDDCFQFDPLIFLALMKQESKFQANAVSYVGAVGLTQIMPQTGTALGLKQIFFPDYFKKAGLFLVKGRRMRKKAENLLYEITKENMYQVAYKAWTLRQKSIVLRKKGLKLFASYKKEVLAKGKDDRLDPLKAIKSGLKYFIEMMKRQKGDISLALASYNAGPHRVKQYLGIPPFLETISFRNHVLKYYKGYLQKKRALPNS